MTPEPFSGSAYLSTIIGINFSEKGIFACLPIYFFNFYYVDV